MLFFHSDIKMLCVRQNLKIIWRGLKIHLLHNLSIGTLIISSPALFESILLTLFLISSAEKSKSESYRCWIKPWIKGKSDGNVIHYQLMNTVLRRKS